MSKPAKPAPTQPAPAPTQDYVTELQLEVERLQQLVTTTEERYEAHLAEARARIVELELATNPALREAAQRLRASTLPESDIVADAIRVLVDHHDPQDGDA